MTAVKGYHDDRELKMLLTNPPGNSLSSSSLKGSPKKAKKKASIMNWGFPGYLTDEEVEIYIQFRNEVDKRGGSFRTTVYSFTEIEGEINTLTRWLRARKYDLEKTITMVEEATVCRQEPSQSDFYPDAEQALGCDPNLFISQYPQLYSGHSKIGCPVFYSKPGMLNIDGIECITTLEGIIKLHWHVMQSDYLKRLLKFKEKNPNFNRFESVSVLDLDGLTMAKLNARTLDIIKQQAFIDSLCFPETMNKMVIVNAPRAFSITWPIIKGFVDARTASKIEIFSSTSAAAKMLKEIIDEDQLPVDYGGTAENTNVTMSKSLSGGCVRLLTEVMYLKSHLSYTFDLEYNEEAEVWVYTKATTGATFSIADKDKNTIVKSVKVRHDGEGGDNDHPTKVQLTTSRVTGNSLKVKADSDGSRFSTDNFLLAVCIYPKK